MQDLKVYDGSGWQSLKGPPGPSAVSADAGNTLKLGGDGLHFTTAPPDSDSHIWCRAGDDIEAKYEQAKLLTPGGNARSETNRVALVVLPGVYDLGTYYDTDFEGDLPRTLKLDALFVDVIGLGAVRLPFGCIPAVVVPQGVLFTSRGARISGISSGTSNFGSDDSPDSVFDCCSGGYASFRGNGSYINCTCSEDGFVGSGSFDNCAAGDYSFSGTGTFTNCKGGGLSFGGAFVANGTYINCTAGDFSFGGDGTASGTFINCTGGQKSFGGNGTASGTFINCTGKVLSFGGDGTASGTFINCTGGYGSFGFPDSESTGMIAASARLISCRLTDGSFAPPEVGAILRYCLDPALKEISTP